MVIHFLTRLEIKLENAPVSFDAFEEGQIRFGDLPAKLDHFHQRVYDAFHWSITAEALNRFEPEAE